MIGAATPAPVYITVEDAARLVGVDVKTLGRWTRQDATMPVFRRGRVVRLHRERFMAWLESQIPRRHGARSAQARTAPPCAVVSNGIH